MRAQMVCRILLVGFTLSLGPAACKPDAPLAPMEQAGAMRSTTSFGTVVEVVEGEHGPGARYALYRPAGWNGRLIVYAHGFLDPAAPLALPQADGIEALRDVLLNRGYAIAYSSFSENGFAVKSAIQATHQLSGLFASRFHTTPSHVYLMGHSLGGLAAIALAETYPRSYDGALPMCGFIGGSQAEIDYIGHVRLLFDFFYPGVLPGTVVDIPAGVDLSSQVIGPVVGAIQASPAGAGAIASVSQTPVPFSSGPELVESLVRAIGFDFRGFPDLAEHTHGHIAFDNTGTVYSGALPASLLTALNAGVGRVEGAPDARAYLAHYYQPSGRLGIPALTLHDALDPVAPAFHESLYRDAVAAEGRTALLVQRTVARYGHCAFETGEMTGALADLVAWAEHGVVPAP